MKLITWNMQGAANFTDCAPLLARADILCLQECGIPPANWGLGITPADPDGAYVGSFVRHLGRADTLFYITYLKWTRDGSGNGNARCSLCVISPHVLDYKVVRDPSATPTRPMIGMRFVDAAGVPCWVFSVHTKSSGTNAKHYGEIIQHAEHALSLVGYGAVVFVGDFNYEASAFAAPWWGAQVAGPGPTQQSGGNLDWALYRPGRPWNGGAVPSSLVWRNQSAFSDHFAQEFDLTW